MPKPRKQVPLTSVPEPDPAPHEFFAVASEVRALIVENHAILTEIRDAQPAHMEGTAEVAALLREIRDEIVAFRGEVAEARLTRRRAG